MLIIISTSYIVCIMQNLSFNYTHMHILYVEKMSFKNSHAYEVMKHVEKKRNYEIYTKQSVKPSEF